MKSAASFSIRAGTAALSTIWARTPLPRTASRATCSVYTLRRPKRSRSWANSTDGTARRTIWCAMSRASGKNSSRISPNTLHISTACGQNQATCSTSPTRTAIILKPGRATQPRYMTLRDMIGTTLPGWTGAKSIFPTPIRSISTNVTSAHGKCMRTAISIPTASWRTSWCLTSRRWATPTSSSCR